MEDIITANIPKVVFIVPYRNRPQHKYFFSNYIKTIMDESILKNDYEVYFSHQCDIRAFNRGATKNIGFLAVKNKYPDDYKNITFVFNDIDTVPFASIFDYETVPGIVKHFYGFNYALGGIVALNGGDFEAINGYPNFWGWGMEDNVLQSRCEKYGLKIDRSQFYPIGNPNILHLFDGVQRIINRKDPWRATHDNGVDGLKTIHKLIYTIDDDSSNPLDNIHMIQTNKMFVINISTFMTGTKFEHDNYHKYDLREPPRKIIHPDRIQTNKIDHITDDWSNIPFYPTSEKKNQMIKTYGKTKAEEIIKYSYDNSVDPTQEVLPPQLTSNSKTKNNNALFNALNKIQQYKQIILNSNEKVFDNTPKNKLTINQQTINKSINKYSPLYARTIGVKPKATASANIRLGGVYK